MPAPAARAGEFTELVSKAVQWRMIDADSRFDVAVLPWGSSRIDAHHDGFEDVSLVLEVGSGQGPVDIRFGDPANLAIVTVEIETEGDSEFHGVLG